jgi:hypothetical protein
MTLDEMRAELRQLKKATGGTSISKMRKSDLERQLEVYRGMAAESAPAPAPRKAEKSLSVSRREPEAAPKKRVGEMAPAGGSRAARPVAKAPRAREYEEEESVRPAKPAKAPKVVPKAVAKAASKPPKKMTVAVEPEESGSDFE